ncbi:hypothetical protein LTR84_003505 [Exophiala bonariae]|uniref:DUF676 domain-containing protein n=1 Tax=Exophiala bonariae TaxID=1690606 RepID=A0AAV9N757_9EURO|nr:hypothetical protein LTR84_003505 [Exophiala bonariae]
MSQNFGLRELYRPADQEPEIDIVAVHGLNGDAYRTWTYTNPLTDNGNICWLSDQDFLPKYIGQARVLTWGYNANLTTLSGPTSSNRILHHAQTLVQHLFANRSALSHAADQMGPTTSHLRSIFTCTYGVFFFGTPHLGSEKAQLLHHLQKLVSVSIPRSIFRTETRLVKALKAGSEILEEINTQFLAIAGELKLVFLWEEHRTKVKGFGNVYIVEQSSAAPLLRDVLSFGIASDHQGMCRFASNQDAGFITVISELQRYAQDATGRIERRQVQDRELLQLKRNGEVAELVRVINLL